MIRFSFSHPPALLLFALAPLFAVVLHYGRRQRERALSTFGASTSISNPRGRYLSIAIAFCALVLAIADPIIETRSAKPPANTGDVVFLLDVSRSMLSEDVQPNRLARAKSIIVDLVGQFEGERTALVAFGGLPAVVCPLTLDRSYFEAALERASPDSVARGGTLIGDAIRFSLDSVFDNVRRDRKLLIIVTDGGDQGSSPQTAASRALASGVRVLAVGVGDEKEGALVPAVLYHGQPVRTRLESQQLRAIDASYVNGGTGSIDAGSVYREHISPNGRRLSSDFDVLDLSRWLLTVAALALGCEMLMGSKRARSASLALFLSFNLFAQSAGDLVIKGNEASRATHWADAADFYQAAARERPGSPEVRFDLATAWYRLKLYSEASQAFERAAKDARGTPLEMKSKLGLANCMFREAMEVSPPSAAQLRRTLALYLQIPLEDAKYNAEIVKKLLAQSRAPAQPRIGGEPPPQPQSSDAATIVKQGKIGRDMSGRQPVDRDW